MTQVTLAAVLCLVVLGLTAYGGGRQGAMMPSFLPASLEASSVENEGAQPAQMEIGSEAVSIGPLSKLERPEGTAEERVVESGHGSGILQFRFSGATEEREVIDVDPSSFGSRRQKKTGVDTLVTVSASPGGFVVTDVDASEMIRAESSKTGARSLISKPVGGYGSVLEVPDYGYNSQAVSGGRRSGAPYLVSVGDGEGVLEVPATDSR